MQILVNKLQDIIKTHYGYSSELEWRPVGSYQTLHKEGYSTVDHSLSIPLFEPKSKRPIAFFKIQNIQHEPSLQERLIDLVHLSLQTYIDLIDELEVSENIIQYLQTELHPQKIIKLHRALAQSKQIHEDILPLKQQFLQRPLIEPYRHRALLLRSHSDTELEKLSIALHSGAENHFFIRTDHMSKDFMHSINDLLDLEKTTLFIPKLEELTEIQRKTLETYFLLSEEKTDSQLLVIVGTPRSLSELCSKDALLANLLGHFDYFFLLKEAGLDADLQFDSLQQCAKSILFSDTSYHIVRSQLSGVTKSYNIIPSCKELYPTVH